MASARTRSTHSRMIGLHAPHPTPAPQRRPISFMPVAPSAMTARNRRSDTLAHTHTTMRRLVATLRIIINMGAGQRAENHPARPLLGRRPSDVDGPLADREGGLFQGFG